MGLTVILTDVSFLHPSETALMIKVVVCGEVVVLVKIPLMVFPVPDPGKPVMKVVLFLDHEYDTEGNPILLPIMMFAIGWREHIVCW